MLVLGLAFTETTSYGVLFYAYTVFVKPMEAEFGASRGAITGAFSLSLLASGLAGVPVGRWLDRHGPRLLMTVGSAVGALLVLAWSRVDGLPALYLAWAGIGLASAAVLYGPAFWVVAAWFRRKRGQALTLLTFVAGFASVIYIPVAGWLVDAAGWRTAAALLACILALTTIPVHALVLRRRPADTGLTVDGEAPALVETRHPEASMTPRAALRSRQFWLLTAAFVLSTFALTTMAVHLVPYLDDSGFSPAFAASVAGAVGIMALPGRLVLTPLGDHVSRALLTAGIFTLQALGLLVLLLAPGRAAPFGYVVFFGAGFGAITPARASLVADYFGPAHYGAIAGVMGLFLTSAGAIAPVSAGFARDLAGDYTPVLAGLVAASLLGAVIVAAADRSSTPPAAISSPSPGEPG